MKSIVFILLATLVLSCTKKDSPEGVLQDFISARLGKEVTKDYVLSIVTGKLEEQLSSMSDEDFEKFNNLEKLKKNSFEVISKRCQNNNQICFITYSVKYDTYETKQKQFQTETKKVAEMLKLEDGWKIASINHIKTYHESLEPIDALGKTE